MPLTDEWFFTKSIASLQGIDLLSLAGIARAWRLVPTHFREHWVVVPFFAYWPVAEWSGFDSRPVIYLTVALIAFEGVLFLRRLIKSALCAVPVALLLFCPSHYMEFLWGWQLTLTLSIACALAGLVVIDGVSRSASWRSQCGRISVGMFLCLLAALSSAGGIFAFPCAALLVASRAIDSRARVVWTSLLVIATGAVYLGLYRGAHHGVALDFRTIGFVLTALGGTIWGSPLGGITAFHAGLLSCTGSVVVACLVGVTVRAALLGLLGRIALALCISAFGLFCVTAVAMTRPALGNWHLQFALPAVCGAYAAAHGLWRADRRALSGIPYLLLLGVLCTCLFGYYDGFARRGPAFNAYARSIEEHARRYLREPERAKPYPGTLHVDADLVLFLSAHDHSLFGRPPELANGTRLPEGAHIYLDEAEVAEPVILSDSLASVAWLTVSLPEDTRAKGVRAQAGDYVLVLRPIHPSLARVPDCRRPGVVSLAGMVVPRLLPHGDRALHLSVIH